MDFLNEVPNAQTIMEKIVMKSLVEVKIGFTPLGNN